MKWHLDFSNTLARWQQEGYGAWQEFVPAGATIPAQPVGFASASVIDHPAGSACNISLSTLKNGSKLLSSDASAPCQVRVATYFYPYWRAVDETGTRLTITRDSYGLMLIHVPQGKHTIQFDFRVHSAWRTASLFLSAGSFIFIVIFLASKVGALRRSEAPHPKAAVA